MSTRAFHARYSEFANVRNHVGAALPGVALADQQRVVLILEELFCNTVEHGYGGESDQPVWVTLALQAGGCRIRYEDSGPEHDPFLQRNDPQVEAGVGDRPVGGLGIYLLTELASAHGYQRRDGHNVITADVAWGEAGS
jgi:serine/threonine-protein kinase RsbW